MTSAVLHKSTSTTIVSIIMTTAEALKYMKKSTYLYSMVPDPFLHHGKFFSPTGLYGLTDKKNDKKNPKNWYFLKIIINVHPLRGQHY